MFTAYIANQKSVLVLPSHTPSVSASEPPVLKDRHRSFARARQMSKSSARKACGEHHAHTHVPQHTRECTAASFK